MEERGPLRLGERRGVAGEGAALCCFGWVGGLGKMVVRGWLMLTVQRTKTATTTLTQTQTYAHPCLLPPTCVLSTAAAACAGSSSIAAACRPAWNR